MSLLSSCFVPWFLFTLWILGECDGCVLPGKTFSVNLFSWPSQLVCFQIMSAGVGGSDNEMSWGRNFEREDIYDLLGRGSERKTICSRCSATEVGMRLGN